MKYFLLSSFLMLGLALYWPQYLGLLKARQADILATVRSSKGSGEWISKKSLSENKTPKKLQPLRINESLATGTDGEMIVRFKRGAEIRLLPSTFVTFIRKANATLITLRKGEIEVLREGEPNSVLISQGGQDKSLQGYLGINREDTIWIDPQSLDTIKSVTPVPNQHPVITGFEGDVTAPASSLPPAPASSTPLRLSQDPLASLSEKQVKSFKVQIRSMISDRVSRQKNHLFRCYSSLIQKKNDNTEISQGKISIHFTVNNYGKVEDLMILDSEIKDQKFHNCVTQVIKRTDFQPFQGPKVSTLLPLRFDKNLE